LADGAELYPLAALLPDKGLPTLSGTEVMARVIDSDFRLPEAGIRPVAAALSAALRKT
jgi:hypothetical protein